MLFLTLIQNEYTGGFTRITTFNNSNFNLNHVVLGRVESRWVSYGLGIECVSFEPFLGCHQAIRRFVWVVFKGTISHLFDSGSGGIMATAKEKSMGKLWEFVVSSPHQIIIYLLFVSEKDVSFFRRRSFHIVVVVLRSLHRVWIYEMKPAISS